MRHPSEPFSARRLPRPSRPRVGRPSKLGDNAARLILLALVNGADHATAARYVRVHHDTLAKWLKRNGEPYATFQAWVREAESAFEMHVSHAIHEHGGA